MGHVNFHLGILYLFNEYASELQLLSSLTIICLIGSDIVNILGVRIVIVPTDLAM